MSAALEAARTALSGQRAWLVGGAPRDRALGRCSSDLDVVVDGDPAAAARAIARAASGASGFELSEEFGAWRVVARDRSWQLDVEPLRAGSIAADLALRDFTVNAIAEPLAGGEPIDPLGGLEDLAARRLRLAGPEAFASDPLRVLRLTRLAVELELDPDRETLIAAREWAARLAGCSAERVFVELRRIVSSQAALRGLRLMSETGATAAVLPELEALRGVQQSRFHHTDVYGHTMEVLEQTMALSAELASTPAPDGGGLTAGLVSREQRGELAALMAGGLADELTRAEALRWGALLHDLAKPLTREVRPGDGRVTFIGHDSVGAEVARTLLGRLRASERLRSHVAALVRHHLRLGFLVHEPQPLARRTVYAYLRASTPVAVDVTLLSVADRLATRGERSAESIEAHMQVARNVLADALRWQIEGPPAPLLRGDRLARELGIPAGPRLGELLEELAAARYAGEVSTPEQALAHARRRVQRGSE
jgi:poly(A) polymerase